jgi:hypothetical protein
MSIHGLIVCVLSTLLGAQKPPILPRGHAFREWDG